MNPATTGVGGPTVRERTAVGVFPTYAEARRATDALRAGGYQVDQIGILGPDEARRDTREERSGLANDPTHTRWEEGTGVGATVGGLGGLGLGAVVAAGLMSPIGPVVAGGALVALIASAGAGAAVGTVVGGLIGLGVPEEDARWYAAEAEAGRVVVTVRGESVTTAQDILDRHGATRPDSSRTAVPGNATAATPY